MNTNALSVSRIYKAYGATRALNDLSLSVAAGEFVALLGPNGAGKSTLFMLLTGLFSPDSGDINVAGYDLKKQPTQALARMGVVFQQSTLDLDLSVEANLNYFCGLHNITKPKKRIAEWLAHYDLTAVRHSKVRKLSGGNRRRIELVRSLLHEPSVLLMDEASVGLDIESRHKMLQDVHAACQGRKMGVLWATHLVEEAQAADRIIVVNKGSLVAEGTSEQLCAAYNQENDLTQAFLTMINNT